MARIDIVRNDDGSIRFNPPNLVLSVGEVFFFRNLDTEAEHWITMPGRAPDLWFPRPLGANTGKRPRTSHRLALVEAPSTPAISYACVSHPAETGTITLVDPSGSQ